VVHRLIDAAVICLTVDLSLRHTADVGLPDLLAIAAATILVHHAAAEFSGLYRSWRGSRLRREIAAGDLECGIAAGVEDMFAIPMGGFNPSFHPELYEMGYYMGMGETAENLAKDLDIPREEQEEFSVRSHTKALEAWQQGCYDHEVVTIQNNGTTVDRDEGPRQPDVEKMRSLKPAFLADGTITAATSSPISIGAAAVLVCSDEFAAKKGLTTRARIVSRAVAGVDWTRMGAGPIPASAKALERAGLDASDIDFFELNEAFAAQSLYVLKKTGWPLDKVNVHGGAIALGHPLGASGARILATLLNVLEKHAGKRGLATMCIGTGQGIATVIERA